MLLQLNISTCMYVAFVEINRGMMQDRLRVIAKISGNERPNNYVHEL